MCILFLEAIVEIHTFLSVHCLLGSGGWWKSPASGRLSRKKVRECRRKYRVMQQFTPGVCSVWDTPVSLDRTPDFNILSMYLSQVDLIPWSLPPLPILIWVCILFKSLSTNFQYLCVKRPPPADTSADSNCEILTLFELENKYHLPGLRVMT